MFFEQDKEKDKEKDIMLLKEEKKDEGKEGGRGKKVKRGVRNVFYRVRMMSLLMGAVRCRNVLMCDMLLLFS